MTRRIEVDAARWPRWLENFADRHDGAEVTDLGALMRVRGADGAVAQAERLDADPLALLLVRRGGYAVGLAEQGRLIAHRCGTRYVQSRTAAGGWSQQRFARRRGNQADELVRAVAEHAARILPPGIPAGLVLGGDRSLAGEVLEDPRVACLAALPRRELYDIRDPNLSVLGECVQRARSWWVQLEPEG